MSKQEENRDWNVWVEDLVAQHNRTVDKWLKRNETIGDAYAEANREAAHTLTSILSKETEKVDRLEVIDESGRAYVKGSIYASPVKVELSYQDDGRTLKVFVKDKKHN